MRILKEREREAEILSTLSLVILNAFMPLCHLGPTDVPGWLAAPSLCPSVPPCPPPLLKTQRPWLAPASTNSKAIVSKSLPVFSKGDRVPPTQRHWRQRHFCVVSRATHQLGISCSWLALQAAHHTHQEPGGPQIPPSRLRGVFPPRPVH